MQTRLNKLNIELFLKTLKSINTFGYSCNDQKMNFFELKHVVKKYGISLGIVDFAFDLLKLRFAHSTLMGSGSYLMRFSEEGWLSLSCGWP